MADHAQASIPETMTKGRIAHTSAAAAAGSWNQATDPSGVAFDATTVLDPAAPLTARLDPLALQHDPRAAAEGHAAKTNPPPVRQTPRCRALSVDVGLRAADAEMNGCPRKPRKHTPQTQTGGPMKEQFEDQKTGRTFDVAVHEDGSATVTYTPLDRTRPHTFTQHDPVIDDLGAVVAYEIACDEARMIADRLKTQIDKESFTMLGCGARVRLVPVV